MKFNNYFSAFLLLILIHFQLLAQEKQIAVSFISPIDAGLKINGSQEFSLFANTPRKISLPVGEHFLVLKALSPCTYSGEDLVKLKETDIGTEVEKKFKVNSDEFNHEAFQAIELNDFEKIKLYATCGGDLNLRDSHGATLLHKAAKIGNLDMARFLITRGADVNTKASSDESTPLHGAAMTGKKELVRLLLDNGADVNAKTKPFGNTPLKIATDFKQAKVVELLKLFGGKI